MVSAVSLFADSLNYSVSVIPAPAGSTIYQAMAINDSGQVTGQVNSGLAGPAFVGTASVSTAIPAPVGAMYARARWGSINDSGDVVGVSNLGGWIWDASDGTL